MKLQPAKASTNSLGMRSYQSVQLCSNNENEQLNSNNILQLKHNTSKKNQPSLKPNVVTYKGCKDSFTEKKNNLEQGSTKQLGKIKINSYDRVNQSQQKTVLKYQTQYRQNQEQRQEMGERQLQNCQNYFLRKTVLVLYKLFAKNQICWNVNELTYVQLLIILKQLKYVKYSQEQFYSMETALNEELKKCFYLWMNISQGKTFSLTNLIIVLLCLENLEYDEQLICDIVEELSKGIQKFKFENKQGEPKYIFFIKKQNISFSDGIIKPNKKQKQKIQIALKSLRYRRWMQNHPEIDEQDIEADAFQQPMCFSKKTEELASNKRQQILRKIRERQPEVQNIELYHILNYKEQAKAKQTKTEFYQSYSTEKKQVNKENINYLAKPKELPVQHSPDQAEYLKNKNQYTFHPNISNQTKKVTKCEEKKIQKQKSKYRSMKEAKKLNADMIKSKTSNNNKKSDNQSKEKQIQNVQYGFETFTQLHQSVEKSKMQKQHIIDELQWQQIPKELEQISLQNQLYNFKDDFKIEAPLSQTQIPISEKDLDKQKKRRQYLDLPILFVDVNIEEGKKQRIVIYDGDKASTLAADFGKKHRLTNDMIIRLQAMLVQQIGSVLSKIDEAVEEDCSLLY